MGAKAESKCADRRGKTKRKTKPVETIRGIDDKGYCYEWSCGSCKIRNRCSLLVSLEVEDADGHSFAVLIEAYRVKAAKYAVWKWLNEHNAESPDGRHVYCYSKAEALDYRNFGEFAKASRVCHVAPLCHQSPYYCIAGRIDATLTGKMEREELERKVKEDAEKARQAV